MKLFFMISIIASSLIAQALHLPADTTVADSIKIDSLLFGQTDTLGLKFSYPSKGLPQNIISMPKPPRTPLDIDMRESSYYTPRDVQDKMDQIMNRPRSDSFLPVLAMAAFAASVAAKQLEIEKLFELDADDYLVADDEFEILKKLWIKAPQTIDELYLKSDLKNHQTAGLLQERIVSLSDKNLIKTRGDNKNILFYPAQKLEKVRELFRKELSDNNNEEEIEQLKAFYDKLENIKVSPTP
jgi:predicted transcriptional regulator